MGATKKGGWGDELMDNMVEYVANHFFYSSLKKNSGTIEELAREISKMEQDKICELLCILGGIISGHIEYSEKLSPDLEALNEKWASSMNKIPKSEKEDLK